MEEKYLMDYNGENWQRNLNLHIDRCGGRGFRRGSGTSDSRHLLRRGRDRRTAIGGRRSGLGKSTKRGG